MFILKWLTHTLYSISNYYQIKNNQLTLTQIKQMANTYLNNLAFLTPLFAFTIAHIRFIEHRALHKTPA